MKISALLLAVASPVFAQSWGEFRYKGPAEIRKSGVEIPIVQGEPVAASRRRFQQTVFDARGNWTSKDVSFQELREALLDFGPKVYLKSANMELLAKPEFSGDQDVIAVFVEIIENDPSDFYRGQAMWHLSTVLADGEFPKHAHLYKRYLQSQDSTLRYNAAIMLVKRGAVDDDVVNAIGYYVENSPWNLPAYWLTTVNPNLFVRQPKVLDLYIKQLQSQENYLWDGNAPTGRDSLARNLAKAGRFAPLTPAQLKALIDLLSDPSHSVRLAILQVLAKTAPADPFLIRTLKAMTLQDPYKDNRALAQEALDTIADRFPSSTLESGAARQWRLARMKAHNAVTSDPGVWWRTGASRTLLVWKLEPEEKK